MPTAGSSTAPARPPPSLYSDVWDVDFDYNPGGAGSAGGATATCRRCDKTFCAGGRHGTSHLRRHAANSCPERQRQPSAPPTTRSDEEQELAEPFYFVDGLNISQLFEQLDADGLVHIDDGPGAGGSEFWPNLPQAANSSSRRFFQKTRERKKRQSKKRCVPDGFVVQDQVLPAQGHFNFDEKRMFATSIHGNAGATIRDYSCGDNK